MKARKKREDIQEQIVKDFEKKKEIQYSEDDRVQELAPEGEDEPEVQEDNEENEQLEE